ncbi:molybdopterin guanine dinucleotide biosynthesis protein MoaE [Neiella marina]|uniref:Molybdopterin synthase catalytic subunit n=1 Tax=Neiella marina TaxID=508461 RepID=A0A8J2XN53_9GAMM|nr:molybdopterin synthase catalytic subunit MoaE [Neiella marina]GGA70584.1 molybdopterin guanine dinucleotide biosynthesis protein MoaE [Neiella marina]
MTDIRLAVNDNWIDVGEHLAWLTADHHAGAMVNFIGQVRQQNLDDEVTGLVLEHYPAMTEKSLMALIEQASERWPLLRVSVFHRVGALIPGDPIVFVGVSSAHRDAAFEGARFLMDKLKTQAPFWKKETTKQGDRWLDARACDSDASASWD